MLTVLPLNPENGIVAHSIYKKICVWQFTESDEDRLKQSHYNLMYFLIFEDAIIVILEYAVN